MEYDKKDITDFIPTSKAVVVEIRRFTGIVQVATGRYEFHCGDVVFKLRLFVSGEISVRIDFIYQSVCKPNP